MTDLKCNCKGGCIILSVIASLVVGIITSFLSITTIITISNIFLGGVFATAVVYLGLTFIKTGKSISTRTACVCPTLTAFLTGILGTILLSALLLTVGFIPATIVAAVLEGVLAFFFTLMITSGACLIRQLALCDNGII